jgi:polar amino acid transport system substrate-binding protein
MEHTTPIRPARTARRRGTALGAVVLSVGVVAALSGCAAGASADTAADGTVTIGAASNGAADETTLRVAEDDALHDALPADVKDSGELVIGVGALPSGFPPLAFTGDDQKTITGAEPDLGRLVAAKLGLRPTVKNSTWDNLFVGIDSGSVDVGFSNVTDTEQRKEKYDFASYREDNIAFQVLSSAGWTFDGDPSVLAGKTIAVASGTNQEKILLEWKDELRAEGKTLTVKYYPDQNGVNLALASGRIDAYLGPNPGVAYQNAQSEGSSAPKKTAGVYSGAGGKLQGLIAATTKKDDGLVEPVQKAINELIDDGTYAKWLRAYHLSNEGVEHSEINPPGLPLDNS